MVVSCLLLACVAVTTAVSNGPSKPKRCSEQNRPAVFAESGADALLAGDAQEDGPAEQSQDASVDADASDHEGDGGDTLVLEASTT
eukprot:4617500-Pyramimonas_sp.AAC.1